MKKIKIIIAFAILASTVSLFFNDCASARTPDKPTFLVSILVTMDDGITPLSGAEVMFKSADVLVSIGITGADGYFHTNLPEGTYDVYAFYPGKSGRMKPSERKELILNSETSMKLTLVNEQTR
jgi:hypothetical protein